MVDDNVLYPVQPSFLPVGLVLWIICQPVYTWTCLREKLKLRAPSTVVKENEREGERTSQTGVATLCACRRIAWVSFGSRAPPEQVGRASIHSSRRHALRQIQSVSVLKDIAAAAPLAK